MSSDTTDDNGETKKLTVAEEAECIARTRLFEAGALALTEFTSRLGGGGFGDLRIEGSKANGHEELFKIKQLLEKVQDNQEKLINAQDTSKLKAIQAVNGTTIKMSGNGNRALESIVERKTDSRFRDLEINMSNALERLNKTEAENKKLKEELDAVKQKQKKGTNNNKSESGVSLGQHRDLSKKVEKLQKQENSTSDLRQQQDQLQSQLSLLQARFESGGPASLDAQSLRELGHRVGALEVSRDDLYDEIKSIDDLAGLFNENVRCAIQDIRTRAEEINDELQCIRTRL